MSELAKVDSQLLVPMASPTNIIDAHKQAVKIVSEVLEDGKDYGVIPGTQGKATLLKPGAERLCFAYGVAPVFTVVESESDPSREGVALTKQWNNAFKGDKSFTMVPSAVYGFHRYVVKCELKRRDTGESIGECIASCSTSESKYQSRPNDCENTVLKMASKRAHVGAVLLAFGLSDRFGADMDDVRDNETAVDKASVDWLLESRNPTPEEVRESELFRKEIGVGKADGAKFLAMVKPSGVHFVFVCLGAKWNGLVDDLAGFSAYIEKNFGEPEEVVDAQLVPYEGEV